LNGDKIRLRDQIKVFQKLLNVDPPLSDAGEERGGRRSAKNTSKPLKNLRGKRNSRRDPDVYCGKRASVKKGTHLDRTRKTFPNQSPT